MKTPKTMDVTMVCPETGREAFAYTKETLAHLKGHGWTEKGAAPTPAPAPAKEKKPKPARKAPVVEDTKPTEPTESEE